MEDKSKIIIEKSLKRNQSLKNKADDLIEKIDEVNIVRKVCKELGLTQKELSEQLDVSTAAVSLWQKGDIPKMAKLALELMLENKSANEKLRKIKEAQNIINSI